MKLLKRVFWGILIVSATLVVLLVGSVLVDYAAGGERLDALANTMMPGVNGSPDVRAFVAIPEGEGPFPVVILIHEFFGLNDSIIGKAEALSEEGYLVVAPDTFRGSTTSWIPRAIYQVISTDPEDVNADLDTVYAWLEAQPQVEAERIAIAGFCYGGRTSLIYSLHNSGIAATVVFYGAPEIDSQVLAALPGPVLGIFGGADQSIPLEDVAAFEAGLQEAGVPHEITVYDEQPHAFVTDIESIHGGGVQGEAWEQMLEFLRVNLMESSSHRDGISMTYTAEFPLRYYAMLVYEHAIGSASHGH